MNRNTCLALLSCAAILPAVAGADDCKYERKLEASLDASRAEVLEIVARAGTLEVTGHDRDDEVRVSARLCVSEEEWLDEAALETAEGKRARVEAVLPDTDGGWSFWGGGRYARMDLEIHVPRSLALDIRDSSGSMDLAGIGPANVRDSSGSIDIVDAAGPLTVEDSSGSISFERIRGDVIIESDSSGSISGTHIEGSVLVRRDSSGSISFSGVSGDFTVERDSSGGIVARDIGGNFTVLKDGSGGIESENVRGEVSVPSG